MIRCELAEHRKVLDGMKEKNSLITICDNKTVIIPENYGTSVTRKLTTQPTLLPRKGQRISDKILLKVEAEIEVVI